MVRVGCAMSSRAVHCWFQCWLFLILFVATVPLLGAEPSATNTLSNALLLSDPLGKLVIVPTNAVPPQLLPAAEKGMTNQIPAPTRGTQVPEPVRARQELQRAGRTNLTFFPSYSVPLAPYLEAQDDHGNTALRPGALIPWTPVDAVAQQVKYWASDIGLPIFLQPQ
jgi:hypothetical protein